MKRLITCLLYSLALVLLSTSCEKEDVTIVKSGEEVTNAFMSVFYRDGAPIGLTLNMANEKEFTVAVNNEEAISKLYFRITGEVFDGGSKTTFRTDDGKFYMEVTYYPDSKDGVYAKIIVKIDGHPEVETIFVKAAEALENDNGYIVVL